MRVALFVFAGLILGLIGGGIVGLGVGVTWTTLAQTSNFEGGAGMLVFFVFVPAGALIGAIAFAIWFGTMAARAGRTKKTPADAAPRGS